MFAAPHAPMQEKSAPTQQENCANLIIAIFPPIGKGEKSHFELCRSFKRCREYSLRRFLFALTEAPKGAGRSPTPKGPPVKERRKKK